MPDLQNREERENRLEAEIALLLRRAKTRTIRGERDLTPLITGIQNQLSTLEEASLQSAENFARMVNGEQQELIRPAVEDGSDDRRLELLLLLLLGATARTLIRRWVLSNAETIARQAGVTTETSVSHAVEQARRAVFAARLANPQLTRGEASALFMTTYRAGIDNAFHPVRAGRIAVTEITKAVSAGETIANEILRREVGKQLTRRWWTRDDERVCPVCGPLHRKLEFEWHGQFPSGTPAHPECRCWMTYELRSE